MREQIFVSDIQIIIWPHLMRPIEKKEGLISVPEIQLILDRYNIGKRPLSLLLGWGEGTLTRYLDGDIPTRQYSDTLKRLLDDSEYMKEVLEQNKDRITDVAYRRVNDALQNNGMGAKYHIESKEKIDHVAKYLLLNTVEVTPMALQKLLYYSQGFFKAFTEEYLFNNDCEAWIHGPVYRNIYYKYKNHGYNPIEEEDYEYGDIRLTVIEKELLDSVVRCFGCYSGKVLEKMTHSEEPWRITRAGLDDNEGSNRIIEKELIGVL